MRVRLEQPTMLKYGGCDTQGVKNNIGYPALPWQRSKRKRPQLSLLSYFRLIGIKNNAPIIIGK